MKISVDTTYTVKIPAPEISEVIQKRLLELGFSWGTRTEVTHTQHPYLCFQISSGSNRRILTHAQSATWMEGQIAQGAYAEVSIADIWSLEFPKFTAPLEVGILREYPITLEATGVRAGCQFINRESFEKLMETAKNYYAEVDKKD